MNSLPRPGERESENFTLRHRIYVRDVPHQGGPETGGLCLSLRPRFQRCSQQKTPRAGQPTRHKLAVV